MLHQDCTETLERSIAKDLVRLGIIRRGQDRSGDKLLFECIESQLTLWRPNILNTLLKKTRERLGDFGEVLNESSAISGKTEKASKLLHILRRFPFNNGLNLGRVNLNALGRDNMPKINHFFQPELALGKLGIQLVFSQFIKHQPEMFLMFFLILRKDQNVVEIEQDKLILEWRENIVHQSIKSRRSISQTKRHDRILIRAKTSPECRLRNVFLANANLMIAHSEIKLGEYFSTFQLFEQLSYVRKWIFVLDCLLVQWAVIDTQPVRTILLLDK